jgi:dTDP-4-amino-4,6-dideoxygalactose transaminase
MDPILALARKKGIPIIEDAACALGAQYRGRPCGSMGELACFSFHPRKVITTGEGGMVVTNDPALAERLLQLRNHGIVVHDGQFRFEEAGLNYRLTDFQGALGTVQMSRLPGLIAKRIALARSYTEHLASCPDLAVPKVMEGALSVWQSYVVLLQAHLDRAAVQRALKEEGIETNLGTYALSAEPYYQGRALCPRSQRAARSTLSLPLHSRLSEEDVKTVADTLKEALTRAHA